MSDSLNSADDDNFDEDPSPPSIDLSNNSAVQDTETHWKTNNKPFKNAPNPMSLNELLELHNDPQLDSRLPPKNPNRPVIRNVREILYGKWNIGPSRGDRLAAHIRRAIHPDSFRRRAAKRKHLKKLASEEQPPKYALTDFHHQLVQEMRVVIENQEACLERLTDLLYQKDAEIERLHYTMLLTSSPPNGRVRGEGGESVERRGGCG